MTHKKNNPRTITRRAFIKKLAAAAPICAAPAFVPARVFGKNAPSNRITLGCIGMGRKGRGDLREFLGFDRVQVVAVCDVDANRMQAARDMVDAWYRSKSKTNHDSACTGYRDFRALLARPDIDAVSIVTPDHWHALPAIAAAKSGKDIFVQKPLTRTISEGRALCRAVHAYGRVLQVGSQQRSDARFRFACELVRNGRIGALHTIRIGLPTDIPTSPTAPMLVPENLDYDMWLGPAPWRPYTENRVHPQKGYARPGWFRITDYTCGMITNWGAHHIDIAQWGAGEERSGPVEVTGWAEFPQDGLWNVYTKFHVEYTYASGLKIIVTDNAHNKQGVLFEGSAGWVYVKRGYIDAQPKSLLTSKIGPNEIHLYRSNDHKRNFLDCMVSRAETVAPVDIAHRSNSTCLIGYIAMQLGRKLSWNPQREVFPDDDAANRMIFRPMRSPWQIL